MKRVLETSRLYLRELVPEDAEMILRLDRDPDVMHYMPAAARARVSRVHSQEFVRKAIRYYEEHPGLGIWTTILKGKNECIGWTTLKDLPGTEEIEIGFRYFPKYWNQGLATEISAALLKYGFEQLNLPRIVAVVHPENAASIRVIEKIGLTYVRDDHHYGINVRFYALDG